MRKNLDKNRQYIKGRLAEAIVEQMYKEAGYVILRYGYESIAQNLVQSSDWHTISKELDIIESAPDFIVKEAGSFSYFLEVKYRSRFDKKKLEDNLYKQNKHWKRTNVIVVLPEEPYFIMMLQSKGRWCVFPLDKCDRVKKISGGLLEEFKSIVKSYFQKTVKQNYEN